MEGIRLGLVGPLTQENRTDGADALREYWSDGKVVMSMRVKGAELGKQSFECEREYIIADFILDATKDIRIITEEEWEEWDEFDGDDVEWLKGRGVSV